MRKVLNKILYVVLSLFCLSSPVSISATEFFLIVVGVLWIAKSLLERRLYIPRDRILDGIFLLLLSAFLSMMFSEDIDHSAKGLRDEWLILVFLVVSTFLFFKREERTVVIFCKLLFIASFVSAAYSIPQFLFQIDFPNEFPGRASGFLGFYMTYGNYQAILFCLTFPWMKKYMNKWICYICWTVIVIGILFSLTRGAWVGLVAGVLYQLWHIRKKYTVGLILTLLVLIGISTLIKSPITQRIKSFVDPLSYGGRPDLWKTAVKMWLSRPIFGLGLDNYARLFPDFTHEKELIPVACHSHSLYFQMLSERGIVGLLSLCFLFYLLLTAPIYRNPIGLGCKSALICFLGEGLTEYNYGDSEIKILLWFIIAVLLFISHIEKKQNLPKPV